METLMHNSVEAHRFFRDNFFLLFQQTRLQLHTNKCIFFTIKTCAALTRSGTVQKKSIFVRLSSLHLRDYEQWWQQLLQSLSLLMLSQGKVVGLAGEADLWRWR